MSAVMSALVSALVSAVVSAVFREVQLRAARTTCACERVACYPRRPSDTHLLAHGSSSNFFQSGPFWHAPPERRLPASKRLVAFDFARSAQDSEKKSALATRGGSAQRARRGRKNLSVSVRPSVVLLGNALNYRSTGCGLAAMAANPLPSTAGARGAIITTG